MKYITLILFISTLCFADQDQIVTDVGLGAFGSKGPSLSTDKFAKVGIEEDLWGPIKQKFNTGGWLDYRNGATSAAFVGYQAGFEVTNDLFQGSLWTGPTAISSIDQNLGSYFEMNETIYFGIVDKDKDSIGLAWNHFSDAGLTQINKGRDYLGLEIKCPF